MYRIKREVIRTTLMCIATHALVGIDTEDRRPDWMNWLSRQGVAGSTDFNFQFRHIREVPFFVCLMLIVVLKANITSMQRCNVLCVTCR